MPLTNKQKRLYTQNGSVFKLAGPNMLEASDWVINYKAYLKFNQTL